MEQRIIRLCDLPLNHNASVARVGGELSERLRELGFIEDATVRAAHRSARGGVTAYEVMGAVFALRRGDAANVEVRF